jgi:hypothetical protein
VIQTLAITVTVESVVCLLYSIWRKKPIGPILITSVFANLLTQSLLWIVLHLYFQHYLVSLYSAEVLIWIIESFLLYYFPGNQLRFREATLLSLAMNLASFGFGWFLPT